MIRFLFWMLTALLPALGTLAFAAPLYPATRKDDSVADKYHGTEVKDPYRWLEDDNAAETKAWVAAQNAVTEKFLAGISQRNEIRERLKNNSTFTSSAMRRPMIR